ncbi:hypothetical protein BKM63_18645 [Flavobacterium johnsoniae]|uniref:Uncharacterized protein n=1 Tax=Flavobacterium johnsoniae TaxID=986 RepID=A0A1J7BQ98_FLAJO|nr:hypothetical protein BKM63_18645 [Flavobacterium johnsoniae]
METLLCQKDCKINTFFCNSKIKANDNQSIIKQQEVFGFFKTFSPAFAPIFYVSLKKRDIKG